MNWINAKDNPPTLADIIVVCKTCKNIHSVHYEYGDYCLVEHCYESGHFFVGQPINFDWYVPLPKLPT